MKRLNAIQKRYLVILADEFSVKQWDDIGAEGQVALLYMCEGIRSFIELSPLANEFLKLIDLEKQVEQL
jgi:hypothetical protein